MKDARMTFRLPRGLRALIDSIADRDGVTSSAWAVEQLRDAVARDQEQQAAKTGIRS